MEEGSVILFLAEDKLVLRARCFKATSFEFRCLFVNVLICVCFGLLDEVGDSAFCILGITGNV